VKVERFRIEDVEYMPAQLEDGVLYVSEKYRTAAHLCPCGCAQKVRTQLGPLGWSLKRTRKGPTLWPSIGNWQKDCRSHYYIRDGKVLWQSDWTPEEVDMGRRAETERRDAYFTTPHPWWKRFFSKLFGSR